MTDLSLTATRYFSAVLIAVFCLFSQVAQARAAGADYTFSVTGREGVSGRDTSNAVRGAGINYEWAGELKLGRLLGSPVVSQQFRYDILGGMVTLPILGGLSTKYETVRYALLPGDLVERVRVYNVKLRYGFDVPGHQSVELVVDVGYTGYPGQSAFNVPGSPDWARLFQYGDGTWVDEQAAQSIWRAGPALSWVRIEHAELSLYEMHAQYVSDNPRSGYDALNETLDNVSQALTYSFGYAPALRPDERGLVGDMRDIEHVAGSMAGGDTWRNIDTRARDWLAQIEAIPERFRQGDPTAYNAAIKDAKVVIARIDDQRVNFWPSGGNVEQLERGYPPRFEPKREEQEASSSNTVAIAAAGARFEPLLDSLLSYSLPMFSCPPLPALPGQDTRATFDAFDASMQDLRQCLRKAKADLDAAQADIEAKLEELADLYDTLESTVSPDQAREVKAAIVGLNSSQGEQFRQAQAAYQQAYDAWNAHVRARNNRLNGFLAQRERDREARREARLNEQNRRRIEALERRDRELARQALANSLSIMNAPAARGGLTPDDPLYWEMKARMFERAANSARRSANVPTLTLERQIIEQPTITPSSRGPLRPTVREVEPTVSRPSGNCPQRNCVVQQ